jgi:tetrahydrodipicolinate N-succinyltransferase
MLISNNKPCVAISFDTATFKDLQYFLNKFHQISLHRVEPDDHDNLSWSDDNQYINLVVNDMGLREKINQTIDTQDLDRFTFVHPNATVDSQIVANGSLIYAGVVIYPNCVIEKDVIIHSNVAVGHFSSIGQGTYISGNVAIGGTTKIGRYCYISIGSTVLDQLGIVDHVRIGPSTLIRKNISVPGTYATPRNVKKISV